MRNGIRTARSMLVAIGVLATLASCGGGAGTSGPDPVDAVALQSISPANGVTGVSITMPMTMRFSGPMGENMERYIALHEGTITAPVLPGRWDWSADRRTLTFASESPLRSNTTYVIHMGGGMQGANGMSMNYAPFAALGGRSVSGAMMGGATGMMGAGWNGADGGYGVVFTFTTG